MTVTVTVYLMFSAFNSRLDFVSRSALVVFSTSSASADNIIVVLWLRYSHTRIFGFFFKDIVHLLA